MHLALRLGMLPDSFAFANLYSGKRATTSQMLTHNTPAYNSPRLVGARTLRQHYNTGQQKNIFFKTCSNFSHILGRIYVLNTMLPSDVPQIKQFSGDYMLLFKKITSLRGHTFY